MFAGPVAPPHFPKAAVSILQQTTALTRIPLAGNNPRLPWLGIIARLSRLSRMILVARIPPAYCCKQDGSLACPPGLRTQLGRPEHNFTFTLVSLPFLLGCFVERLRRLVNPGVVVHRSMRPKLFQYPSSDRQSELPRHPTLGINARLISARIRCSVPSPLHHCREWRPGLPSPAR